MACSLSYTKATVDPQHGCEMMQHQTRHALCCFGGVNWNQLGILFSLDALKSPAVLVGLFFDGLPCGHDSSSEIKEDGEMERDRE